MYPVVRRWDWLALAGILQVVYMRRPDVINIHFTGQIYEDHPMITFLPWILKKLYGRAGIVTHIEYPVGVNVDRASIAARLVRKMVAYGAGSTDLDWSYGTLLRDSDQVIILSEPHRQVLAKHHVRLASVYPYSAHSESSNLQR